MMKLMEKSVVAPASLPVRFVYAGKYGNEKASWYKYQISLPSPLACLILEGSICPVSQVIGTDYTVELPGGPWPALKAAPMVLDHLGQRFYLGDPDPDGLAILDHWESAIKAAFLTYLKTGETNQCVAL